jgi:enoyl-CoA hydratase/carnithine racemase
MTDESISIDTGTDELLCAIRDRVAVITLNRPEARNSLSDHLTPALRRMIKRNGDDPDVGALLITGAGSAFCSGGDVKGMGNNSAASSMSFSDKVARLKERQRTLTAYLSRCVSPRSRPCRDRRLVLGLRSRSPATFVSQPHPRS